MKEKRKMTKWIKKENAAKGSCPVFFKSFSSNGAIEKAELFITATGTYYAELNGRRVSFPLAPGCDQYKARLRVQKYDVTSLLKEKNELSVAVGNGWYDWRAGNVHCAGTPHSLYCELKISYLGGKEEIVSSDETWDTYYSCVVSSDLYDGEIYDASAKISERAKAVCSEVNSPLVYESECEIREQERLKPLSVFKTPKGETVIDFGQEITGYLEFEVEASEGDKVVISHAEVLDKDGNFYTENYRSAKALLTYTCKNGKQTYKPLLTFYGFRYIRLDEFPAEVKADNFTAIVVHSDLKRTGYIRTSSPVLNRFFQNVVWGQKGNFLDIPTDCPQRDERLGWTGDTQAFCRAANYNFDCEEFYSRWLRMLRADQKLFGCVSKIVPNIWGVRETRAAWSDAATIVPWETYRAYGNKKILRDSFESMKAHVDNIGEITQEKYLWTGGEQYGDWLGLDAPEGSYKGSSDDDLIASAFYAYSTKLVVETGKILGEDVAEYEALYKNIRAKVIETYPSPKTQTECILLLYFDLTDEKERVIKTLIDRIEACGNHLETGFVGTPYLLHVLSENGYAEKAWELLLREEFPSWLYSVKQGATTIWEHWDGKNEKGEFWSKDMNSFNHYAYGAVADWMYGVAGGITPLEAGYETVKIAPVPTDKLAFFEAEAETRKGKVRSRWEWVDGKVRYEIETPVKTLVCIDGKERFVEKGVYVF